MSKFTPQLGSIVLAKAGRDKGKTFVITAFLDEQYVHICDGELRRLQKPKKKKLMHLHVTPHMALSEQEMKALSCNDDYIIRRELEKYLSRGNQKQHEGII